MTDPVTETVAETASGAISGLFSNIKVIIGIVIFIFAILVFGYIWYLRHEISSKDQEIEVDKAALSQAQEVNQENLATITRMQRENTAIQSALTRQFNAALARNKEVSTIKERISHDKDAPLAPVLLDTLNSLRNLNSSTNKNSGSKTNVPKTTSNLPSGSTGS